MSTRLTRTMRRIKGKLKQLEELEQVLFLRDFAEKVRSRRAEFLNLIAESGMTNFVHAKYGLIIFNCKKSTVLIDFNCW